MRAYEVIWVFESSGLEIGQLGAGAEAPAPPFVLSGLLFFFLF